MNDKPYQPVRLLLPFECLFPYQVGMQITWPTTLEHNGVGWYFTGKLGTDNETGMPSAEYGRLARRVWLRCDGQVKND